MSLKFVFDWKMVVGGYLLIVNLIGFIMMGVDKRKAIRGAWRISEASFFLTALLGGALGCSLGMKRFRHKTKHWYFKYGMPAIFVVQVVVLAVLLSRNLIPV